MTGVQTCALPIYAFFGAMASIIAGVIVEYIGWHAAFYFASGLFFLGFLSSLALPGKFITRDPTPV